MLGAREEVASSSSPLATCATAGELNFEQPIPAEAHDLTTRLDSPNSDFILR